jgi:hypothetical protein
VTSPRSTAAALTAWAALALPSCSTDQTTRVTNLRLESADSRVGTAIFVAQECPSSAAAEFAPALVAAVAGFGAQFAINTISNAIQQYKDGLTGQFLAGGVGKNDLFHAPRCMIVARSSSGL